MEGHIMDCAACIVPNYGGSDSTERFCSKCRHHLLQKSYCVALREADESLMPFIALDDAIQATEYAGRLGRQGISHVILSWNPEQQHFSLY
ncbi:MAG: hypothetical protein CVV05_08380 [Gammaproteobacteria bacterium HGW-Gammaproteobacteria-1]|jgi:hypothetical protein|nr:MAG: hypothetical protein CVV05_08380 [Gammaproteobacteria bacterium HGW-Gammaproteobacteria-1]